MQYTRGYKYRIYPNRTQKNLIDRTFGCCRFVYNHFLAVRSEAWKKKQESIGYTKTSNLLTELKKDKNYVWLNEVDSMALQETLRNLDRGFQNFFAKCGGYPRFKSKHCHTQSFRTRNQSSGIRLLDDRHIKLPRIGSVKLKLSRHFDGRILNATISKTASGKYYVSLCVEEEIKLGLNNGNEVGIDVGLKEFYSDSQGNKVSNPSPLRKLSKKLLRAQRKLSRKIKGSRNRNRQRIRVARLHEHICNIRRDFLNKESLQLVKENQIIAIENLNIKGMLKNHKLARAISDVSWSEFFIMLEYKAVLYGTEIRKVETFYPSSQTCSVCGYKNPLVRNLSVRRWICPACHSGHDRDTNAAINILRQAKSA